MLIDAMHAEETRVVALKGNRLEEFDYESASKKQLKGSIYLAKVTRVEPSLQAAFVDYGGNRHGFLAFNEIHPDYYQIPVADREALLQEEAEQAVQDAALEDAAADAEAKAAGDDVQEMDDEAEAADDAEAAEAGAEQPDVLEDEMPRPRTRSRRQYKIQEVIKKRQILLVQVVKEERGTKGAALTTYLSLAGRYCVLMPNTARGGGISRKIANQSARRKLKKIVSELDVPEGMGVIVRTAGMSRTKSEIRRDLDYLLRLWDSVREMTLVSTAPTMVYEEASLIKRAIRDVYTKEVEEILVEGEDGYRVAKDFMRLLMPSHAKKVQPYRNRVPLFHRFQVEQQLDTMYSNTVHLRSGGYLVINQTEALVAVDVNSGRSTKERNIEETAVKTNLEASDEVARQLRLRDLAGLIVIDYIDMEEPRNNRAVERRLKDCLKSDRARIQVGRISSFGLLEMSRQRLRPSLFEASSVPCTHCAGAGYVRSTESTALLVLRAIEEEGIRGRAGGLDVHAPSSVALYILNQKRDALIEIESRYGVRVTVLADDSLIVPNFSVELDTSLPPQPREATDEVIEAVETVEVVEEKPEGEQGRKRRRRRGRRRGDERTDEEIAAADDEVAAAEETRDDEDSDVGTETDAVAATEDDEDAERPKRRRRGRRGGRRRRQNEDGENAVEAAEGGVQEDGAEQVEHDRPDDSEPAAIPAAAIAAAPEPEVAVTVATEVWSEEPAASSAWPRAEEPASVEDAGQPEALEAPEPTAPAAAALVEEATETETEVAASEPEAEPVSTPVAEPEPSFAFEGAGQAETPAEAEPEVAASEGNGATPTEPEFVNGDQAEAVAEPEAAPQPEAPKRRGWWQRRSFF